MASRGRNRSEQPRSSRQINRSSLRGASLFALRRLEILEGGREALSRALEAEFRKKPGSPLHDVTAADIVRWFRRGVPSAILSDPVRLAFLFTDLAALERRHDVDEAGTEREARLRSKREKLAFTGLLDESELLAGQDRAMAARATVLERARAGRRLSSLGDRLVSEARAKGRSISRAEAIAEALRVQASTVRRWLADGKLSGAGLYKLQRYERDEKESRSRDALEDRVFKELLAAGRKPHVTVIDSGERYWDKKKKRWVRDTVKKEAARVPTFRSGEHVYEGDATSGYRWNFAQRQFLSPSLLVRMVQQALGVRKKGLRKLPEWAVYVIVSVLYSDEGERAHPVRARSGSGRAYGANLRPDLEEKFPEHANRFVVKDAYSSGNWPSLRAAVTEFEKRLWREIRSDDRTFVHGMVVWTFRRRSDAEQKQRFEERGERAKIVRRVEARKGTEKLKARGRQARAEFESREKKKKG